jgi:Uma2 family endonuclease
MSVPVSTKTSRKPNLDLEDGIEYPSSDGKPVGETGTHARVAMVSIYGVLDRYFMNNPRVAVHANMFMYYVQGDPKRNVCPDAFVAMGVPNEPDRRSYKVWKEGKAPDVVFEVTSRKTRKQDLTKTFEIYRDVLRVREYFLFDPFEEYLDPSLQGYRLVAGSYEPIPMIKGGMPSEVLGLEFQRDAENLRFFNPETGRLLPSVHELAREVETRELALRETQVTLRETQVALRETELGRREAEVARREAEQVVQRLQREVEELRRRLPEVEA